MIETHAARDETPMTAANTRCALCAPRLKGDPSPAPGGQGDAVSHALLLVSAATDEAIGRLAAEALRNGMVLIDARPGVETKIASYAFAQRLHFGFGAARRDVLSDHRFVALLRDHADVHVFVSGSVAEAAVRQTALSALARSCRVTFVDDAGPPHSSRLERTTKDFESRGAFTITTEEFVSLASARRKADPLRTVGSRAPHRPIAAYEQHAGTRRTDGSEDRPAPRPADVSRKIGPVKGRRGYHGMAWTAAVALAAAVAAWQGGSYIGIDVDGALRTTANGLAAVLGWNRSAPTPGTLSDDSVQASVAPSTERDDHRLAIDLARDLAVLRIEFDTALRESARTTDQARKFQLASERALAELTRELRQEKERTASLASELVMVRQEMDRQDGDLAKYILAPPAPALLPATTLLSPIARSDAADPPQQPSNALEAAAPVRSVPVKAVASLETGPSAPATPPGLTTGEDMPRLMARASQLLSRGDIGAARVVLERIAETGNVLALFALAETYDPLALATMGTMGTVGDAAKARDLYTVALAKGVEKASDRLRALLQSFPAGGTP